MNRTDQTTRQGTSLRLRAEHRPDIDLDKLALALLNLVREPAKRAPRPEPRRG